MRNNSKLKKNQRTAFYVLVLNCGNAPLNFNQTWCSQTRTIYISLDRPQRSATLLKWLCHLGTTKYQMMTRYRHNTLDLHCSWHFGSKQKHLPSQIPSCVVWHLRDSWYTRLPDPVPEGLLKDSPMNWYPVPGVAMVKPACFPFSKNYEWPGGFNLVCA